MLDNAKSDKTNKKLPNLYEIYGKHQSTILAIK